MATSAKIFRINYKSDFILTLESDAGWMTPFCIKFWTGSPMLAYYASFDGETYTHCAFDPSEPTKLLVQFDDHHLPIGDLKFQVAYHFTVADFPNDTEDEVLNQADITTEIDGEEYQVMLDFTGETAPEIQFSLPAYANEAQRIANEQQRIANEEERIAAETIRIQNEQTRIAQEQIRQQNEQQRINQEQARVNEYAGLKADAVAATGAANDAAALANQKAQLAADKAALAQSAANLANAKAQLAADKAALADAAATLANQKAALAQQKAEYAQEQGTYSKNQGDYAKEQGDYSKAKGDYAKDQGDYSKSKGDYAKDQGDYSKQQGDYAKEQGEICAADHLVAVEDHQTAAADHQTATTDHSTASSDHTQAGNDHTRAESDHTRAESDHAAVEVYVDSLGAFDISAYHATGGVLAEYADLTAALGTNGANIPDALRKGGMSVKFVQSSDNKYVQFRLMAQNFTTDVTQWQGVDDVPTAGSVNLVESGGVKSEIDSLLSQIGDFTEVLVTNYDTHRFTLSGNAWYQSARNCHVAIPLIGIGKIKLTSNINSNYGFFTSDYTTPVDKTEPVTYLIGSVANTTANTEVEVSVPENAAYLYLPVVNGGNTEVNWSVSFQKKDNINKQIHNLDDRVDFIENTDAEPTFGSSKYVRSGDIRKSIDDIEKKIEYTSIDLSVTAEGLGSIGDVNWYQPTSNKRHKVIPAHAGDKFKLQSQSGAIYAWLTDAYTPPVSSSDEQPIPFVSGTSRVILTSTDTVEVTAPEGTAYLCVNTVAGDGNTYDWNIHQLVYNSVINEMSIKAAEEIYKQIHYSKVDISAIKNDLGCLATNSNWYGAHSLMRHKVIPAVPGERFRITPSSNGATIVRYGWLTSDYTPPSNTSSTQVVPFVDGTESISMDIGDTANIITPQGAAYLCLNTVDGGKKSISWNVRRLPADSILDCIQNEMKPLEDRVSDIDLIGVESISYFDASSIINKSKMKFDRYSNADMPALRNNLYSQGSAINNGYFFIFRDTGVVDYYSVDANNVEFTYVGQFYLGSTGADNHCNSVQFVGDVVEGTFPYLYVSSCRANNFKCFVESITLANNVMTSTLKQTITLGSDIISSLDFASTTCDIVADDKYLYAVFGNDMYSNKIAIVKLNKPLVSSGDVTLGISDVINTWYDDTVIRFVRQGMKVYGRHLYISNGGTYSSQNYTRGLNVYNTLNGEKEMDFNLEPFTHQEIEDVELFDDKIFIFTLGTNYYVMSGGIGS